MLTVMAINRTGLTGLCSYDVQVKINAQVIWQGSVTHEREKGWPDLLHRIADVATATGVKGIKS